MDTSSDRPDPHVDPAPPEGPGGADAVPDWEQRVPDPVVPDPPRSAQVSEDDVPDAIQAGETSDEESQGGEPAEDTGPTGQDEPAG